MTTRLADSTGRTPGSVTTARLMVLAAAVLFSTGGAVIKHTSLTAWQVAGLRSGVAALALLAFLPAARQRWQLRHLVVGSAYASTLILFVTATKLTTAANAIFLQSTAPLYIALMGPLWLRERIGWRDAAFLGVMAIGGAVFFAGESRASASAPDPGTGDVLALMSGFMWALTVTGLRWLTKTGPGGALATVVCGNVVAFVVCLPLALPIVRMPAADIVALGWLGVFQIGVAYLLLTTAVQRVTAFETSLLLLAEPVLNPVWEWIWHGERPAALAATGGAIILLASALRTLTTREPEPR